jgi:hypothetical protein
MLEQLSHARRELREEKEKNSSGNLPPQFSRNLGVLNAEAGKLGQLLQQHHHQPAPPATVTGVSLSSLAGLN